MAKDSERLASIEEKIEHLVKREDFIKSSSEMNNEIKNIGSKLDGVIEHYKTQAEQITLVKGHYEALQAQVDTNTKRIDGVEADTQNILRSRLWNWGNSRLFWYSAIVTVLFILTTSAMLGIPQAVKLVNTLLETF